ncbi:hypothetical protein EV426DRAFT_686742 [Tirmania nivea]|nr:hypothetical protein EV426DRAFT_686742 [Tirmania nivea]
MSRPDRSPTTRGSPIKITVEWALNRDLWTQAFYNVIDGAFPELEIDFGTPVKEVINKILVLYNGYIVRQPQGTHILAIERPTERQLIQIECLRGLIRQEQQATLLAAVRGRNSDLVELLDMNAHWLRLDGSIRLLFPRTSLFQLVATRPNPYPPVNPSTAVESPYAAGGQFPTTAEMPQDGTYLAVDDTPPVSSTEVDGEEYSEEITDWEGSSSRNAGNHSSAEQDTEVQESSTQGFELPGSTDPDGACDGRTEGSDSSKGALGGENNNDAGEHDATRDESGDVDAGAFGDNEDSGESASTGGESDERSGGGERITLDEEGFCDESHVSSPDKGVITPRGNRAPSSDTDSMPGLTHGTSAEVTPVSNSTSERRREGHSIGGDQSDPSSSTNDSPHDNNYSEDNQRENTAAAVARAESNNPDSESAPDDEAFAGALPADEIVPIRRHIGDHYDSDDEATEQHLFEDIYGHGVRDRNSITACASWWTMYPKLLLQLCKFEHVLRNEVLVIRTSDHPWIELQNNCRKRTDRALELMMWLGAVLLSVSHTMPDDHVDEDHQRKKFRMGKLTRQVIRGISEADAVVNSVRQAGEPGGSAMKDTEGQLKRIHRRCARRRDMLRKVTGVEVDLPEMGELELCSGVAGEGGAEEGAEQMAEVGGAEESRVDSEERSSRHRWICGEWKGSARVKIEDITGIPDLRTWMWTKRIRWAASVYRRALPELREIAEGILKEVVEPDAVLHWMSGSGESMGREGCIAELNTEEVAAWSDGSRQEGVTAAAAVEGGAGGSWEDGVYLGSLAMVMDAEMLGVIRAWQAGRSVVALDSQGAIGRLRNLCFEQPRSWIEELAAEEMGKGGKMVMWVKGHSGVEGNERADRKAKEVAWVGRRMLRPDVITPAGIRQAFPMGRLSRQTKEQGGSAGMTYIVTDRGPQRWWLHKVGRVEGPLCGLCEEGVAQNAVHLLSCLGIADGKGREWKQIWEDPEWCEKLAGAVRG